MTDQNPVNKPLLAGLLIAGAAGYFTYWYLGVFIALIVIYATGKAQPARDHTQDTANPAAPKPFLANFGDTFKMPACYESKKEIGAIPCDITGTNGYDGEVVGESQYRTTIWASIPSEHAKSGDFRLYFITTLVQEDDNEHDRNAVAVKIKGTVGYLPKNRAKAYRTWAIKNGIGSTATCRGVVVGHKGKDYSIWLDMPI